MSRQHEYYIINEMHYQAMLAAQRVNAETAKHKLLALEPQDLISKTDIFGEEIKKEYLLVRIVNQYFDDAIFFQDSEVIKKLKLFHLKPAVLRWFISLKDIHIEYEFIRKNNIKIDALFAFTLIKLFLKAKLLNELLLNAVPATRDGTKITQLTNELINLKSRRKYSGANPPNYKNDFYRKMNEAANEFMAIPLDEFGMEQFDIHTFLQISRGKTETIVLKLLLEQCFEYDPSTMSRTKLLSTVYGLFRLLLQDRLLVTKNDFFDKKRGPDKKGLYESYKRFETYQAKTLKSIIYPKRKTE